MSQEKMGWIFWVDHNGTIRNFTVGVENEDAAKLAIQGRYPDVTFLNFVSKQLAPWHLIEFLGLAEGKAMEWVPANPRDTITPIGSDMSRPLK
jgi:hypothetical protein